MYNTDETGFVMGHAQSQRVIEIIRHPRDKNGRIFPADLPELNLRGGQTLQDGSREFATAICCVCADGTFLDSAIIFKAQNLQDSWFTDMAGVPKDFLFGVSPNGWTDTSKALAWLERSFGPGSASEIKATNNLNSGLASAPTPDSFPSTTDTPDRLPVPTPDSDGSPSPTASGIPDGFAAPTSNSSPALQVTGTPSDGFPIPTPDNFPVPTPDGLQTRKWRLLMFDGHISHVNKTFLHRCLDYQVLPVCLPPHTTHFLQPLDVSVFGPLKHAYSDLLQAQYAKGERGVWKGNFYKLFDGAQKKAFTSANILSGFRHTGLWPVDFSIVEERMKFESQNGTHWHHDPSHQPSAVTSPLRPLFSLSPTEVFQITTPRNPRNVHHLHQAITTEFSQTNQFEDWATRYAIEKLANSATAVLHE